MDPHIIIQKIERYAAETGLKKSTICQRAFGNARYLDRLKGRIGRLGEEVQRFEKFEAENPPSKTSERASA